MQKTTQPREPGASLFTIVPLGSLTEITRGQSGNEYDCCFVARGTFYEAGPEDPSGGDEPDGNGNDDTKQHRRRLPKSRR